VTGMAGGGGALATAALAAMSSCCAVAMRRRFPCLNRRRGGPSCRGKGGGVPASMSASTDALYRGNAKRPTGKAATRCGRARDSSCLGVRATCGRSGLGMRPVGSNAEAGGAGPRRRARRDARATSRRALAFRRRSTRFTPV
jgi:hypothetical protein